MPRGRKASKSPPNTAVGATGRVEPGQERRGPEGIPPEGRIASMDVTLTATSGMGDDKTPLALRVEQAMNEAGNKARESGAEPDEILRAKVDARNRLMGEVTGEVPQPSSPKASKKAAKAPRKAATSRKAKK